MSLAEEGKNIAEKSFSEAEIPYVIIEQDMLEQGRGDKKYIFSSCTFN